MVHFLHRHIRSLVALLIGVALVSLALPRAAAAYLALSSPLAIFDIEQGRSLDTRHLVKVEADIQEALSLGVDTASLKSQLSYLSFHRIQSQQESSSDRAELQATLAVTAEALQARPLDAYLWTRYTHVRYLLEGMSPYTLAALERSFLYGSNETELFEFRIKLCMLEWERLPSALQESVFQQVSDGASHTPVWARTLADLPADAGKRLLSLLAGTDADAYAERHGHKGLSDAIRFARSEH